MNSNNLLYISYSWEKNSSELISKLITRFQSQGITYKLDKEQLGPRGNITQFMKDIGSSENTLIILSDRYLKSEFCMYELNQIYRNSKDDNNLFVKRTYFLILEDAKIFYAEDKQNYIMYWKEKVDKLFLDSNSEISLKGISDNCDDIITVISSLNIPFIQLESCDIERISFDIQKWLNKEEEPNLNLIKRILNSANEDIHEINLLKKKYPRSYFVSLLEISLLFRKGIEFLTHETSIEVWEELQRILNSRDEIVYKTAFCFKVILYIEYFNKWKVSAPDNDMSYKLSIGESRLITDYLLGIELSNGAHKLIRNIYKKY